MSVLRKLQRLASKVDSVSYCSRLMCTIVQQPKPKNILKYSLYGAGIGTLGGAIYSYYKIELDRKHLALEGVETERVLITEKPDVTPSRRVSTYVQTAPATQTLDSYYLPTTYFWRAGALSKQCFSSSDCFSYGHFRIEIDTFPVSDVSLLLQGIHTRIYIKNFTFKKLFILIAILLFLV